MKRLIIAALCAAVLGIVALAGPVRGQTPPPPPPPNGGTPYPTIAPPCSPGGCPTNTPTITPTPTVTPTSTPTATPTNTPIPLFATVKLSHKSLKAGTKEKISVTTLPGAHITIQVQFPNKSKKHHGGYADSSGLYSWSFKQPANVTTAKSKTGKVKVTANNGTGSPVVATKKFTIT